MHQPRFAVSQATLERIVRPHLRLFSPGRRLAMDTDLGRAGLGPEEATDLLVRLEDELGIRISDDEVTERSLSSLAEIRKLVESGHGDRGV